MIQIRPISDLRNQFKSIENIVNDGETVYLTKNGYGTMVVMSLEKYADITDNIELALDEADLEAETTSTRYTHNEVFSKIRGAINGKK
jgi:prevent-host-death family protein